MVTYEYSEDRADLFVMFCGIVGEYEDVVKVSRTEDVEMFVEDGVHERLKGGRSVGEAKGHNEAFVQAPASTERCGLDGVGMHANEVEGSPQVETSKKASVA